jgi:hypothetical protein
MPRRVAAVRRLKRACAGCGGWAGVALALSYGAGAAHAYVFTLSPAPRALYLAVGTATLSGGSLLSGGTPGNNPTVNLVSVSVPVGSLGSGPVAMTTNNPTANSLLDNFSFCSVPAEMYIGGFFRAPSSAGASATLTVTAPASLIQATSTLPMSSISWTSGGIGDATPTIPSGSFVGGAPQSLLLVNANTWFESCLRFSYANASVVPAGTYTARVVYTLTAP